MRNKLSIDNTEIKLEDGIITVGINDFSLTYKGDIVGELSIGIDYFNVKLLEIRYVQIYPGYREQGLLTSLVNLLLFNGYTLYGEIDEYEEEKGNNTAREVWTKLGAYIKGYNWVLSNK